MDWFVSSILEQPEAHEDPDEVLCLLLSKKHGRTVLRNLTTLVVNGKIKGGGKASTDQRANQARKLAQDIYEGFQAIAATKTLKEPGEKLALTVPQKAMAHEMADTMRTHFRRLPKTIVAKV